MDIKILCLRLIAKCAPAVVIVLVAIAQLMLAPTAAADAIDATYLSGLQAKDITAALSQGLAPGWVHAEFNPVSYPDGLLTEGHAICNELNWVTPVAEGEQVYRAYRRWITPYQADFWVGDAIGSYCPQQAANVHS